MKYSFLLIALIATMVACQPSGNEAEKPDETAANNTEQETTNENATVMAYFGQEITKDGAISANDLMAKMDGKDSLDIKVAGTINETCKKKGCWMTIDLGNDQEMRVKFKDYGFFVPKDADGYSATFEGKAFVSTVPVETLRHYAEDAGKSKEEIEMITEPEHKIAFEATGVIIDDYKVKEEKMEE